MNIEPKNDGELLTKFASAGDQTSFEELVRRHSRMVFSVCRRITGSDHDAEEATQAVFLTLTKKAKSLQKYESIGGWLHHSAHFVSLRLRESEALRKSREEEASMSQELLDSETPSDKKTSNIFWIKNSMHSLRNIELQSSFIILKKKQLKNVPRYSELLLELLQHK